MIRLLKGDILSFARHYKGPRFHAILCDPPYHLGESGFMNKDWDAASYGISFNPETWAALGEHLLPGAFIFVFGSSRGWHRLAVAIEDAGFVFHPSIMMWGHVFGSGFPKATRVDTQVDDTHEINTETQRRIEMVANVIATYRESKGLTRSEVSQAVVGTPSGACWNWEHQQLPSIEMWPKIKEVLDIPDDYDVFITGDRAQFIAAEREVIGNGNAGAGKGIPLHNGGFKPEYDITLPATELAQTWQHHRYGRQAMKPAVEMILCAQKPYSGKPVDSIVATGAGAINIDASRIGISGGGGNNLGSHYDRLGNTEPGIKFGPDMTNTQGRWPANFVLSHTPDCVQVGTREIKAEDRSRPPRTPNMIYGGGKGTNLTAFESPVPTNGTEQIANWQCAPECPIDKMNKAIGKTKDGEYHGKARFFFQSDWHHEIAERLAQADPVRYQAKASRRERDAGLQGMPTLTVDELSGGGGHSQEYQTKYQARKSPRRNPHPTLKPIELCRWLATLLLPPDAYAPRRILVPFAGTASEMIGAGLAGWEHIVGIELSMENVLIGEARLNHWLYQPQQGALL